MRKRQNGKTNDHSRDPEILYALERKKIEYDPNLEPWERQPTESARNHGFFMLYRDFGRIRTVRQVAEASAITYGAMTRIARFNKWVDRAGLWDAEQDRIAGIRLHDAREEMAKVHARTAQALMKKALQRLETLNIKDISPHALILMIDTAAKIERAALGLETLNKGATAQTSVTVAATTSADEGGQPSLRVEVGVRHDQIMAGLDELVKRMSPEQIAAGYEELTASAEEANRELDAALPAPPPQ